MSIKIGHASKDERGKYTGGAAGDQTGVEVYTRTWYNRPWTHVLRATDAATREKLAVAMEHACASSKIGYDQGQRNTLLTAVRSKGYDPAQASTACETDCSALVCVCCMYAGIPESALYIGGNCSTTSTLRARLMAAGGFETLTDSKYLTSDSYLLRGDILLYEGHHCAVALENGAKAVTVAATTTTTSTAASAAKTDAAKNFDKSLAGTYTVTASALNLRAGAGTGKTILTTMPKGKTVRCYGYYTSVNGTKWLCVTYGSYTGFCSAVYLTPCK